MHSEPVLRSPTGKREMTSIRWKIYKALCWIAWRICPDRDRIALGYIWDEGMRKVASDLSIEPETK